MNNSAGLLWTLIGQIPLFITVFACAVFVMVRWKRSPRASLLALIGLVLIGLHFPIFSFVFALAPDLITRSMEGSAASYANVRFFFGLIGYSAQAVAFAFLLAAIFMRRDPA